MANQTSNVTIQYGQVYSTLKHDSTSLPVIILVTVWLLVLISGCMLICFCVMRLQVCTCCNNKGKNINKIEISKFYEEESNDSGNIIVMDGTSSL